MGRLNKREKKAEQQRSRESQRERARQEIGISFLFYYYLLRYLKYLGITSSVYAYLPIFHFLLVSFLLSVSLYPSSPNFSNLPNHQSDNLPYQSFFPQIITYLGRQLFFHPSGSGFLSYTRNRNLTILYLGYLHFHTRPHLLQYSLYSSLLPSPYPRVRSPPSAFRLPPSTLNPAPSLTYLPLPNVHLAM